MEDIKILLVGVGYWGKNWYKTIRNSPYKLVGVVDPFPTIQIDSDVKLFSSLNDVENSGIDYTHAIVATPAAFHSESVIGLDLPPENILVEKPCGLSKEEVIKMGNVYPGFLFLHSPQYKKIKENFSMIGTPLTFHTKRCSMGPRIRTDVSIIEDYLIHDLYMFMDLFDHENIEGAKLLRNNFKSPILPSEISLFLEKDSLMVNMFSSWWYPLKERKMVIIGTDGSFIWENDDLWFSNSFYKEIEGKDQFGNIGYELNDISLNQLSIDKSVSNLELELEAFVKKERPFSTDLQSKVWNLIEKIKS